MSIWRSLFDRCRHTLVGRMTVISVGILMIGLLVFAAFDYASIRQSLRHEAMQRATWLASTLSQLDTTMSTAELDQLIGSLDGLNSGVVIFRVPVNYGALLPTTDQAIAGNPDAVGTNWIKASASNTSRRWVAAIDPSHLDQQIFRHVALRILGAVTVSVVLAAILVVALQRFVLTPVRALSDGMDEVQRGQWGRALPKQAVLELDNLVTRYNEMSSSLSHMENERRLNLERAARLQRNLNADVLDIPGLALAHWHAPADLVGGDYFDAIRLPDDSWVVCVADVTGHGVAAAMGASILKVMLHSVLETCGDVIEVVRAVDRRFSEVVLDDDFASLLLLRWNPASMVLSYVNAGHEDMLRLRPNQRAEIIPSTGTLIGLGLEAEWESRELTLDAGDLLVLVTDGITEAMDEYGRQLGRQTLRQCLSADAPKNAGEAMASIRSLLHKHTGDTHAKDDMTVLCLSSAPHRLTPDP